MILPTWLELLATKAPHAEAIVGPAYRTLTYGDLDQLRRKVRSGLVGLGLGPRDRVAVVMPVGQTAAAMVTAVAASAACMPLNPDYVERELRTAFVDFAIRAVIADPGAVAAIAVAISLGIPVLSSSDLLAGEARTHVTGDGPRPDDIALLLHTSGTTARPKVVALKHATLLGIASKLIDWFRLAPADRCLNLMPVYNAHGTEAALFSTIFSGSSIVCLPGFTTSRFFDALRTFEPSWYTGGATFNHAIAAAIDDDPSLARRGRLRFLRSGSARLPDRARQTLEHAFGVPMIESYAMTEAGLVTANPLGRPKAGTAGIPIAEEVAIVDGSRARVPKGQTGQIIIRGPLVATRYENDPEASAASFKDGWLLTGDQGYFDEDGYLVVTGRIKELISRGGDKISPLEVEGVLLTHQEVAECAAFGIPHPTLGQELGAAVVLKPGAQISPDELRRHLEGALAAYKVPRVIKIIDAIPKTPVGKLARTGLHARLELEAEADPAPVCRTYTPLEAALAGLWSVLLKREPIAPDQDFFLLGGDSLQVTRLLNSVHDVFGVKLSVRAMFGEAATIAGMARSIESARKSPREISEESAPPASPSNDETASLSFAQQRLWFLHVLEPKGGEYNVPWAIRLRGALDRQLLTRALDALIERHHSLRTRFVVVSGEPRQVVDPATPIALPFHDLSELDERQHSSELERLSLLQVREPFDLTKSRLLRLALVRQAPDDHVLLVTIHHIVFDRWSMAVFQDDLAELYSAYRNVRVPALPPLTMQYPAFAAWQRDVHAGPTLSAQLDYWRRKLAEVPSDLTLPFDHPRPTARSRVGGCERVRFDSVLVGRLRSLARQSSATLFMVMLAGFQALLHRYSGQSDFVVGSPVAGRRRVEVERLIGFFVNTLALRADVSGDPTFEQLIARARATAIEAYANQDVPFERLIEELKPERHANRPPLVQVVFALQNVPVASRTIDGLSSESYELHNEASKFDLWVAAVEQGDSLDISFNYDCDLFDAATIRRLIVHCRNILVGGASDPGGRVSALPLLDEAERWQIIVEWNRTKRPFPETERIEVLFAAHARRAPDRVAVVADDLRLSYAELDALSDEWAEELASHGARSGELVGLCMERSGAMIAAMLAVLKAGCAYIPFDPLQPERRLHQIIQDAAPVLFVTDARSGKTINAFAGKCLSVGAELPLSSHARRMRAPLSLPADAPACVLFTSGSTGQPKGVVIAHPAIVRLVINTNFVELGPDDVVAQAAHASFDAALLEIWGALLNGACVTVVPRDILLSPAALKVRIEALHVSVLFLTTALFNQVAHSNPDAFASLRCLIFGGEPASSTAIRSVLESGFKGALINGYGPTEATTFTTTFDVRNLAAEATRVPVGRPIANTVVYILDQYRQPVPIGVIGEVFIGGPGLALGYLNQATLTAERFVDCEIEPGSPVRLYRTGDLARYLPDGTLDVLGRIDDQVKIRGFRIEPAEIEAALRRHRAVEEAAVIALADSGNPRLIAYLVGAGSSPPTNHDMRAFLARELPDYMIPCAFIWLDALPIGSTGKVDRSALPAPAQLAPSGDRRLHVAPRTLLEHQLVSIWEDLLGVGAIGITDDFFALGGHSLLAVRMLNEIERLCGRILPVSTLFEGATIAELALAIRSRPPAASAGLVLELKREGRKPPFFYLHGDYINGGFYCRKIADLLDPDQPMIALLPHGIDGTPVPATIEAMADEYIKLMRERQPTGPYRLGGLCNGGLIAFEMARRLKQAGESVDALIMIEPPDWNLPWLVSAIRSIATSAHSSGIASFPPAILEAAYAAQPRIKYYQRRLRAFSVASPHEKLRFVMRKLARSSNDVAHRRGSEPPTAESVKGAVPVLDELPTAYVDAIRRYQPGDYGGPALYIASKGELESGTINPRLWRRIAGKLTIQVLPGDHRSIVTRNVADLTLAINQCLAASKP